MKLVQQVHHSVGVFFLISSFFCRRIFSRGWSFSLGDFFAQFRLSHKLVTIFSWFPEKFTAISWRHQLGLPKRVLGRFCCQVLNFGNDEIANDNNDHKDQELIVWKNDAWAWILAVMNMERWSFNSKDSFKSRWHEIVRLSTSKNPWTRSRKKQGIATLQAKKLLWILSLQKIKRFSHDCSQEDTSDFSSDAVEQIASQLQGRWVCKDLLG